jgi:hypothetical protein
MTLTEPPADAVVRLADETELLAILRVDDPDPVAPGETPRYLYRGRAPGVAADPEDLHDEEGVQQIRDALAKLDLNPAGQAWLNGLHSRPEQQQLDELRLLADLYGLRTSLRSMSADPMTALYFARHDEDGNAVENGMAIVQRVRLSDFHELAANHDDGPRLVDVRGCPSSVAARPQAQSAMALADMTPDATEALRTAGGWQAFLFQATGSTHGRPAAEVMPTDDPLRRAL